MADTIKVQDLGEGTHEAVALKLLQLLYSVESFSTRAEILDAYVECRDATFGSRPKAGLQLADVVAGAFFQAVELNRGGQVECDPSHAKLLKPLMHHNGKNWYLGFGVKPMPLLPEMNLTSAQKQLFTAYGANANSWKKKE